MATYTKDLTNQTTYTLGVADSKYTTATIRSLVKDLNDNRGSLVTAAATVVAQHGVNHPDNASLPLRSATAHKFAPDKAVVLLRYAHEPSTLFYGTLNSFNLPAIEIGLIGVDKYRTKDGVTFAAWDDWYKYLTTVPVLTLVASGEGTASPLSSVWSKSNTINGDTVTWSGYSIPPNTVRFDGFVQRGKNVNGVARFYWDYTFTIRPDTWIREYPNLSGTTPSTELLYGTAVYANQFPLT